MSSETPNSELAEKIGERAPNLAGLLDEPGLASEVERRA
jgi:hypothetical protein